MISTRDGRTFCARFVILGPGPLSNPKIPDFEGRDTFEGHSFHSNAWDHDYDLAGKRVAVIGSGASAAQIIPAIAPEVGLGRVGVVTSCQLRLPWSHRSVS